MTDLDKLLDTNPAPAVRTHLSARILAAAETAQPANDIEAKGRARWSLAGIAAMAVMAAIFVIQPNSDPAADEWQQIADNSGFSDLYEWVEDEEG